MAINKFYAPITVQGASTYANAANDEVLTKSAVAGIISTSVGNNSNLPTGAAVQTYVSGLCSTTGGSGKDGKIVKLDSNGLLDTTMLPSLAITDTFTAASKSAMLALSNAKKGDICIRTDENKTYILTADGYATEANWTALATPTDAVLSVNTKTGAVTLGASDVGAIASSALVTSVASTSTDATVPSALAVYSFVNGGYAPKTHSHTSANITDSVAAASGVTSTAAGLVQAKAVYDYVAGIISGLDLANTYAAKSHTHVAADLPTATSSAKGIASFGTGLTVSSGAVTLSAATADALGGVKVGTGNGLTYTDNKITMALASGTTAGACKQGTGTTVSSGAISVNFSTDISADATSDVKAATPKAVKTYVDSLTGATSLVGEITGNGTATKFAVAHTFGTDVLVQIVESTTGQIVGVPTTLASNSVTVEFATAPASGTKFKVYISKCVGGDSPVAATVVTA